MKFGIILTFFLLVSSVGFSAELEINVNEGELLRIREEIQDIVITNPEIADVRLTQDRNLFIYGKNIGQTHIVVLGKKDRVLLNNTITVSANLKRLKNALRKHFPESQIDVTASPGRIIMSGLVSSAADLANATELANGFLGEGGKIINQMSIKGPNQINVKVRVMEMNRVAIKEIGLNWDILLNPGSLAVNILTGRSSRAIGGAFIPNFGSGGGGVSAKIGTSGSDGDVSAVIDALVKDELVTVLAEPNLTSRSGSTASFFAGGEFPIPIAADNNKLTIEFKKFGVILDMTPTILSQNKIRLHIKPEVSELTATGAIVTEGISIPGVAIRRTEATIELSDGQSFSVAGMFLNQRLDTVSKVPWLGDIDVLGPLFRSKKYQNSESELVIVATVSIVRPTYEDHYRTPLELNRENELEVDDHIRQPQYKKTSSDIPALNTSNSVKFYGPHGIGERD